MNGLLNLAARGNGEYVSDASNVGDGWEFMFIDLPVPDYTCLCRKR